MSAARQIHDLIQPKALARSLAIGSWILLRLIAGALLRALRAASTTKAPTPAPAAPKGGGTKSSEPPAGGEQTPASALRKAKATSTVRSAADLAEQIGIAALVLLACGGVGGSILLNLLRPYVNALVAILVLGWIIAALTADAIAHPRNDHEKAGEEPEDAPEAAEESAEGEQEGEPWHIVRDRLRRFVEERVAAGAAGHKTGVKGRGARVDDLLAEQQEAGALSGMDRKGMLALLSRAGITCREQMKFRVLEDTGHGPKWMGRNVPGVHVEDLAEDLGRTPRLPAHLVPSLNPSGAPVSPPDPAEIPAQETARIPPAREAGK